MCRNQEEFLSTNFKGKNKRVRFFLYRQIHRRNRLMLELFHKDNKRYEWLKNKLNLQSYELVTEYPYKRETKYEKFIKEVEENAEKERAEKLNRLRASFEEEKKLFFKEKERILLEINKEISDFGFGNLNILKGSSM